MSKRLTEQQFRDIERLDSVAAMGDQTKSIAYRCLVLGERQADLALEFGVTRGAVSQAVNRVWSACPPGYALVSAIVTEEQALQVRQWEQAALKAIKGTK